MSAHVQYVVAAASSSSLAPPNDRLKPLLLLPPQYYVTPPPFLFPRNTATKKKKKKKKGKGGGGKNVRSLHGWFFALLFAYKHGPTGALTDDGFHKCVYVEKKQNREDSLPKSETKTLFPVCGITLYTAGICLNFLEIGIAAQG